MAAHQAPPSLGFSRQEHWSGLPFPSPMQESKKWKWSCSVMSDSSDPMDCSLPGSSIHGIFQARVLEWGAIAFSKYFGYLRLKAIPLEKILMLGKTEGRRQRAIEDEIVGWHYWFNGHESEQTQGHSEGQGSLACCSSWGCKELDRM